MSKDNKSIYRNNYDYEEDDYDRLKNNTTLNNHYRNFTNKSTKKKSEFDYEEDHYEPKNGI